MPSLSRNMNIVFRCSSAYKADKLEGYPISASHYFYILAICRNPGISQEALSKRLYLNKSSIARALQSLEADGLITRKQSESDRRITLVYPTEKAEELLPVIKKIANDWNSFLFEALTEEEQENFTQLLGKVTARAASYVDGKWEEEQ